jgi:hypothetical protein
MCDLLGGYTKFFNSQVQTIAPSMGPWRLHFYFN